MLVRAWLHDLRLTVRGVRRAKAFYATAVLTLAVGMAGATVMFTLIRGVLLRPLPVPEEDRLVVSWRVPPTGTAIHVPYRSDDVEAIARGSRVFDVVSGVGYNGAFEQTWEDGGRTFTADTAAVMGEFFAVAGVVPHLGSTLTRDHDRRGTARAVVLSFGAWQRLFGGAPDIVGRTLMTRGHSYHIAGVMPADFEDPRGVELWTTLAALADGEAVEAYRVGLLRDVELIARLRHGVTPQHAEAELAAVMTTLDASAPVGEGRGFTAFRPVVRQYKTVVVGDMRAALVVLFAAVGIILLIAAANVANLLLLRSEARRREWVVRAALGATRARLVGAVAGESLVIALLAGGVGLVLSHWSLQTVTSLVPDGLPRLASIRTDAMVLAFTVTVACAAAMLAGLLPAVTASRLNLAVHLRAGGRGTTGSASARGRRVLVTAQVALAVTVVAAAGLLGQSLQRLQSVDMGLAAERLVLVELDVPRDRFADQVRHRAFLDAVAARIATAPGIEAVTPLNVQPFAGATGWELPRFTAEGQGADDVAANPALNFEAVYLPYFSTLGVSIVRGRAFSAADGQGSPKVVIVSDAVATATWPGEDPVGKRLKFGGLDSRDEWKTVVGVAASTRYRALETPRPTLYVPAEQFGISAGRLAVRTAASPAFVAGVVRGAVAGVDADVRVVRVAPFEEYLRAPLAWPRFNALLLSVFAVAALLLSAIGLYGVIAAAVRQRFPEIGVRIALGASARDVRRLVLGEGLRLGLAGAGAGLLLSVAATRVLRHLLYEAEPLDLATLGSAAAVLVAVAVAVTYLPARRATRVDPVVVLRGD